MNINRLKQLAEWLEAGAPHERITFDMSKGISFKVIESFDPKQIMACKTSCCMAGAAVQFFNKPEALLRKELKESPQSFNIGESYELKWLSVKTHAASVLGLDKEKAELLFEPNYGYDLHKFNDPQWAARTIRHLIATGEVDWLSMEVDLPD